MKGTSSTNRKGNISSEVKTLSRVSLRDTIGNAVSPSEKIAAATTWQAPPRWVTWTAILCGNSILKITKECKCKIPLTLLNEQTLLSYFRLWVNPWTWENLKLWESYIKRCMCMCVSVCFNCLRWGSKKARYFDYKSEAYLKQQGWSLDRTHRCTFKVFPKLASAFSKPIR